MGKVYIVEAPGGAGESYQCPYCSMAYSRRDNDGREVICPARCRRCGSPMDIKRCHDPKGFADQQAEAAAKPEKRDRQTVEV